MQRVEILHRSKDPECETWLRRLLVPPMACSNEIPGRRWRPKPAVRFCSGGAASPPHEHSKRMMDITTWTTFGACLEDPLLLKFLLQAGDLEVLAALEGAHGVRIILLPDTASCNPLALTIPSWLPGNLADAVTATACCYARQAHNPEVLPGRLC